MKIIESCQAAKLSNLPPAIIDIIDNSRSAVIPDNRDEILYLAVNESDKGIVEVSYDIPGKGSVTECTVTKCKNGLVINFTEPYMRRRDPDCLVIADSNPTDKPRFIDRFGESFEKTREETLNWLKREDLIIMPFIVGKNTFDPGEGSVLIAPRNAAFFVGALADIQGMINWNDLPDNFIIKSVIYLAPPFRHTHFQGKQVVVHNRLDDIHEVFSYNLYPGPSAKKGIYGVLLANSETNNRITLHGSTVQAVTPYDNITTIMHEGASGSGKSEMLEYAHRLEDGRLLLGKNIITGEIRKLVLNQFCTLHPVTDDMALCLQTGISSSDYLTCGDAEKAWFVRLDHIKEYGTDPRLEHMTIQPPEPLIFLNIESTPNSTCLIWEHVQDSPGVFCPNPRVILPRRFITNNVDDVVEVMFRNFGIRTPPCTQDKPSYGIVGLMHILPASLAWLWRLVSPRGHDNPSIIDSDVMSSEGVGSYWPFATGRMVDHANMLLQQVIETPKVRYTLTPNQYIGSWKVGYMPQWVVREYLARKGLADFQPHQIEASRCSLLGYSMKYMQVEGTNIPNFLLRVEEQPEVGIAGYEKGSEVLTDFFKKELKKFLVPDLLPKGRQIIECCLQNGAVRDYEELISK